MNEETKHAYLERSLARIREEGLDRVEELSHELMAELSIRGRLQSGAMIFDHQKLFLDVQAATLDRMVRRAFEATGATEMAVGFVEKEGQALSNALTARFKSVIKAANIGSREEPRIVGDFVDSVSKATESAIDDFRHGFARDAALRAGDPVVNLALAQSSPGAIQQVGGTGNVLTKFTSSDYQELREILDRIGRSAEVSALPQEQRESVEDIAETMRNELDAPVPDGGRLRRWGKRLSEILEKLGISVIATGISKALYGG